MRFKYLLMLAVLCSFAIPSSRAADNVGQQVPGWLGLYLQQLQAGYLQSVTQLTTALWQVQMDNANSSSRLSRHLQQLRFDYAGYQGVGTFSSTDTTLNLIDAQRIMLTVSSSVEQVPQLIGQLQALGMTHIAQYKHLVSGVLPIAKLSELESVAAIRWVSSHKAMSHVGSAYNAGEAVMFADVVKRQEGVDGSGVTIGVLSDSYNCLGGATEDMELGDLPANVQVVKEYSFCDVDPRPDEGRAMMQLIHDIAPGAKLLFYTAWEGPVAFAQGILALQEHGADIIVDDIGYLTMPMFQAGPIAQAVDEVTARGVSYFSAAGNAARMSYANNFIGRQVPASRDIAHDFGLAAGQESDFYQRIVVPADTPMQVALQWDSPSQLASGQVGADADLDVFLLDAGKSKIVASSREHNIGHEPVEFFGFISGAEEAEYYLYVRHIAGKMPTRLKYIIYGPVGGNIQRADTLSITKNKQGQYVLLLPNSQVMESGSAVVVLPTQDGRFDILNITELALEIENDEQDRPVVTMSGGILYLDAQPLWYVPEGYLPVVLANGDLGIMEESTGEGTLGIQIQQYATASGTIVGHANAAGAITVGAMSYRQSPLFAGQYRIENFSSAGGTPLFFDAEGQRLAQAVYRAKPEIVAVDDVDTTFFPLLSEQSDTDQNGLPNFQGTSAAAPNAAALAALLLQKHAYLDPEQLKQVLMQGTLDLLDPANIPNEQRLTYNPCAPGVVFDWGTGCGLLQADLMFAAADKIVLPRHLGDFNADGCIDAQDSELLRAVLHFGRQVQANYDLTGDGVVTDRDFTVLQALYSVQCTQ